MAEEVLIDVKIDKQESEKQITSLTKKITGLQKANRDLQKENKAMSKSGQENSEQYVKNSKQIEINKQKISENVAARKSLIQTIISEDQSIKGLRARNLQLTRQRDQITTKTEEGRRAIAALNKQIDINNEQIRKNVSRLEKQKINIGNYPKLFGNAARAVVAFVAASGLSRFIDNIIRTTAEFQKLSAVLINSLGSRSEAQQALKDIQEFASRTPFSVVELTDSFVKLVNQGFKPTIDELENLGDLASAQGKSFDQLTEAIIDAQTGEFERLKEFGIRASKEGDRVTFTFKGVKTQTDFTNESIREYILSLGDLQGVSGGMAAISETLGGKISNLGDNIDALLNNIGSATSGLIGGILNLANNAIGALNESMNNNINNVRTENAEINLLVNAATDLNVPTDVRSQLISELNSKYPDFLKNLDAETITNEQLSARLEDVNQQFIRKIALISAQQELQKVQDRITTSILRERDLRKNIADLQRQQTTGQQGPAGQAIGAATGFGGVSQGPSIESRIEGQQRRINEIQKERADIQKELISLTSDLTSALDLYTNSNNDFFESEENNLNQQGKKDKLSKEELKRIERIRNAENELTIFRLEQQLKQEKSAEKRVQFEIDIETERALQLSSKAGLLEQEKQVIIEKSQQKINDIIKNYNKDREDREKIAVESLEELLLEQEAKYAESIDRRTELEVESELLRIDRILSNEELLEEERQLILEESQAKINDIIFKANQEKNKKILAEEKKTADAQKKIEDLKVKATVGGLELITRERSVARIAGNAIFKQDAIKETFINTRAAATAAYKALAGIPYIGPVLGIAAAAAAAAYGAYQIASITGIQFARGGMARTERKNNGGVLRGPSHRNGGIPFTVGGRPGFEAEGGEAIINKRSTAMFRDELSAINQAGGGVPFATGGITDTETRIASRQAEQQVNINQLAGLINQVQTVLVLEDFETKQGEVNQVQNRATVVS